MKVVRCVVEADVKLYQDFTIRVEDPTDDEQIDEVLDPEWHERMDEMLLAYPLDGYTMKTWKLVEKEVIEDE